MIISIQNDIVTVWYFIRSPNINKKIIAWDVIRKWMDWSHKSAKDRWHNMKEKKVLNIQIGQCFIFYVQYSNKISIPTFNFAKFSSISFINIWNWFYLDLDSWKLTWTQTIFCLVCNMPFHFDKCLSHMMAIDKQ